jgi:hypothetical protein
MPNSPKEIRCHGLMGCQTRNLHFLKCILRLILPLSFIPLLKIISNVITIYIYICYAIHASGRITVTDGVIDFD